MLRYVSKLIQWLCGLKLKYPQMSSSFHCQGVCKKQTKFTMSRLTTISWAGQSPKWAEVG